MPPTAVRKLSADKFEAEIKALYSGDNLGGSGPSLDATNDLGAIQSYLRACIELWFPVPQTRQDEDLFVPGLDSHKTVEIVSILKGGVKDSDV